MNKIKISKPSEVVLDGKRYLLEEGDVILLSEGMISRIIYSILKRIFPFMSGQELHSFRRKNNIKNLDDLKKLLGD